MKSVSLFIAAIAISILSCGQDIPDSKVPSVVLNAVKSKYPGAGDVDWEKKKDYYKAEFDIDKVEHTFHIDESGKVLQHKKEITLAELPAAAQENIKSSHAGFEIDDIAIIEKNGQTFYEVELEAKGQKDKKVYFDTQGKAISKL